MLRGAEVVARGAIMSASRARQSQLALIDGTVGIVWAPAGSPQVVLTFAVSADRRITEIHVMADPDRLDQLQLAALPD